MSPDAYPSQDSSPSEIEFRAFEDDAWYSVRLLPSSCERLKLTYCNLPDCYEKCFDVKDFRSSDAIQDLRSRFRPVSPQLQDSECGIVTRGTLVCASHSPSDECICFYDAIVDVVDRKEHGEECTCSFIITWRHGPDVGKMAIKQIESICLVQPLDSEWVYPKLASFIEVANQQKNWTMAKSSASTGNDISAVSGGNSDRSITCKGQKSNSDVSRCASQRRNYAGDSASKAFSSLDRKILKLNDESEEDTDLGGLGKYYMILVENLEKDLSSSSMEDFLQLHTSVSTRACVFPCLSSESFARGAILVDSEKNLKKLHDFLQDPDQIIISNRGRPWMATEKLHWHNIASLSPLMPTYIRKSPKQRRLELCDALQVVRTGTVEYIKAKKLKELFSYFAEKQTKMHGRLAAEEGSILKQTPS